MSILKRSFVVAVIVLTVSVAFAQDQRSRAVASGLDPVPLRDWPVVVPTVKHMPQDGIIGGGPALFGEGFVAVTNAVPGPAANFISVVPCRVVDTRNANGTFGGPKLVGGSSPGRSFPIPSGSCPGIPVTAAAYSVNLTAFAPEAPGFFIAYPTGAALPLASNVNYDTGQTIPNSAIVPAGTGGAITIFTSANAHVIIDINGYFFEDGPLTRIVYGGQTDNSTISSTIALFRTLGTFTKNNASTAITATWQSHIRVVGPGFCEFELRIDNTRPDGHGNFGGAVLYSQTAPGNDQQVSYTGRWASLAAGTHTASLWFRAIGATTCTDNFGNFEHYVDIAEQ